MNESFSSEEIKKSAKEAIEASMRAFEEWINGIEEMNKAS